MQHNICSWVQISHIQTGDVDVSDTWAIESQTWAAPPRSDKNQPFQVAKAKSINSCPQIGAIRTTARRVVGKSIVPELVR